MKHPIKVVTRLFWSLIGKSDNKYFDFENWLHKRVCEDLFCVFTVFKQLKESAEYLCEYLMHRTDVLQSSLKPSNHHSAESQSKLVDSGRPRCVDSIREETPNCN